MAHRALAQFLEPRLKRNAQHDVRSLSARFHGHRNAGFAQNRIAQFAFCGRNAGTPLRVHVHARTAQTAFDGNGQRKMSSFHFSAQQLSQDRFDGEEIGIAPNEIAQIIDYRAAYFGHRVGVSAVNRPLHRRGKVLQDSFPLVSRGRTFLKRDGSQS